jgi:ribonuclease E
VLRRLRETLARDKTRTQVFEVSNLGLVEMTRKNAVGKAMPAPEE